MKIKGIEYFVISVLSFLKSEIFFKWKENANMSFHFSLLKKQQLRGLSIISFQFSHPYEKLTCHFSLLLVCFSAPCFHFFLVLPH